MFGVVLRVVLRSVLGQHVLESVHTVRRNEQRRDVPRRSVELLVQIFPPTRILSSLVVVITAMQLCLRKSTCVDTANSLGHVDAPIFHFRATSFVLVEIQALQILDNQVDVAVSVPVVHDEFGVFLDRRQVDAFVRIFDGFEVLRVFQQLVLRTDFVILEDDGQAQLAREINNSRYSAF